MDWGHALLGEQSERTINEHIGLKCFMMMSPTRLLWVPSCMGWVAVSVLVEKAFKYISRLHLESWEAHEKHVQGHVCHTHSTGTSPAVAVG